MLPLVFVGVALAAIGVAEWKLRKDAKAKERAQQAQNTPSVKGESSTQPVASVVPSGGDSSASTTAPNGAPPNS